MIERDRIIEYRFSEVDFLEINVREKLGMCEFVVFIGSIIF